MQFRFNLLLSTVLLFIATDICGQELVSSTLLGSKTQAQLYTQFNIPFIQFGAKYFKITYTTHDVHGLTDTVSGLLVVPDNPNKVYPRVVYQHGTSGSKQDVPTVNYNGGEGSLGLLFGGLGYVALLPDYLGLGVSDGFHPYVHAESEAWVAADMLRAASGFAVLNGINTNDQLFITGYSQGGHAAMALHREIEQNLSSEFTVTAAAPMSGPYSIGEVMRQLILTDETYYYPAYIPNTALSYQTVYGNIFNQLTDIFKPAYAGLIGQFYSGNTSLSQLNDQLIAALVANEGTSRPFKMLQDSIIQVITNNPDHPINLALKANNTYNNWTPLAPMRLFYCMADDQVPFENSIVARDSLLAAGATDFQVSDVNPTADHGDCFVPAITNTLLFFLNFQQIGDVSSLHPLETSQLTIFPNPARDFITLKDLPAKGQLKIVDYFGHTLKSIALAEGDQTVPIKDLPDGIYMAEFQAKRKTWREKLIIQH
ncbi:MAG TPA: T9SS type A sorting domain-containing protein [Saprospiraceae bacterium]|nr:T9SS type A sorting domain-containing protein [Saprospiraceae bacterium]